MHDFPTIYGLTRVDVGQMSVCLVLVYFHSNAHSETSVGAQHTFVCVLFSTVYTLKKVSSCPLANPAHL